MDAEPVHIVSVKRGCGDIPRENTYVAIYRNIAICPCHLKVVICYKNVGKHLLAEAKLEKSE